MINTLWESTVWQSDMQLIGKVALSATAVFVLALAYRFYKLRKLESTDPNGKHDLGCSTEKSTTTTGVETPPRDYMGDETGNLRFRCVHNNLQNSSVTDRGNKNLAAESVTTHQAQEGLLPGDVICKDQKGLKSEDAEQRLSKDDPLQSQRQLRDDSDGQTNEYKDTISKTQSQSCRQDPEGGEMQEKTMLAEGSREHHSKDVPPGHQNHQVSSTPMQDDAITDGSPTPMLRKMVRMMMESSSHSITDEVDLHFDTGVRGPQPPLTDLLTSTTNDERQEEISLAREQNVFKDHQKKEGEDDDDTTTTEISLAREQKGFKDHREKEDEDNDDPTTPEISQAQEQNAFKDHQEKEDEDDDDPTTPEISQAQEQYAFKDHREKEGEDDDDTTTQEVSPAQEQHVFKDHQKKEGEDDDHRKTQEVQSTVIASVSASSSFSNKQDQDSATAVQSRPNSYRIASDEDFSIDVHLTLENCYEVLCLGKKNNHNALITAAYKIMSNNYLHILQNPTIYGRLNATERDVILEGRMKGRRFVVVADIDTQVSNAPKNQSSLSYYDSDNDQWHALSHIPSEAVSRGCSMATLFNYIFIVLGSDGLDRQMKPSKRVLCYNPSTDSWRDVAPLKEARPHCKLVALDGCLYAIGGECLHTVERYDPRLNRWSYIAPLPNDTFAVAHMATACDDEIYVTGGTIRYMLLRYNHREKIWKNSLISGSKDRTTEIIAANNFLYRFDLNRNMGISAHRCNIRARIWYECATYAMPYPSPFQCVVIDNNIYCISRNFHLRFLADEVSPRFMEVDLQTVPSPKGLLYPLVLVLPAKGIQ